MLTFFSTHCNSFLLIAYNFRLNKHFFYIFSPFCFFSQFLSLALLAALSVHWTRVWPSSNLSENSWTISFVYACVISFIFLWIFSFPVLTWLSFFSYIIYCLFYFNYLFFFFHLFIKQCSRFPDKYLPLLYTYSPLSLLLCFIITLSLSFSIVSLDIFSILFFFSLFSPK